MRRNLKDRTRWHPWLAWHPVMTDCGHLVWMEYVERRESASYDGLYGVAFDWQYRLPLQGEQR